LLKNLFRQLLRNAFGRRVSSSDLRLVLNQPYMTGLVKEDESATA
jgi:hypothetical protein